MIRPTLWQRAHDRLRGLFHPSPAADRLNSKLDLCELEERIFLSATPIAPELLGAALDADESAEVPDDSTTALTCEPVPPHDLASAAALEPDTGDTLSDMDLPAQDQRESLVIIDTSVTGYEDLVNSLLQQQKHDDALHLLLLDANQDGVDQITRGLEQYDELASIHILSHGTDGTLRLGSTWLGADLLAGYAGQISGWGDALAEGGDLLFYGCNLAASEDGRMLLEAIHALTGKDIAASLDATGHTQLGGDWTLEFTLGHVTATEVLTPEAQASWLHTMSSETVRDNFSMFSYSGSDGTQSWSSDWSEIGESDGAGSGFVQVVPHDLGSGGTNSLMILVENGIGIERVVNLENASTATLRFSWQRNELDAGFESLAAQISGDGGSSWTTLETISFGLDPTPNSSSYDVSSFISANTHIRFVIAGTGTGSMYLDEVHLDYETAVTPEPLPPTNHAPVIGSGDPLHLSDIAEDNLLSTGTLVSDILASAGDDRVTDADTNAAEGMAVIGVDNTCGQWQYDATGSGNWQAFGTVALDKAVLLAADSRIRFVPQADYNGSAGQITFRAWDQTSGSVGQIDVDVTVNGGETAFSATTATASLQVTAVNDAPVWTLPANLSVDEDTRLDITGISISDVDVGSQELLVSLTVDRGTLSLGDTTNLTFSVGDGTNDSTLTFTGALADVNVALATLSFQGGLNEHGSVVLSASVSDQGSTGAGGTLADTGQIGIQVFSVNDTPTTSGLPDVIVDEDAPMTRIRLYDVFADVEDADNALQYELLDVTNPDLYSNVMIDESTGRLLIRYGANMHGESDITVRVTDSGGLYVDDTLHVTVNSINDTPVATADNYAVRGDETLITAAPGILLNDSDVDGDALKVVLIRAPQHGKLFLNPDGSFRYKPDPSFVGIDSFVYAASDGQAVSERAPVFIKVSAPTSPVDSGSQTPVPKTNPNSPLTGLFSDVTPNLVSLLNQESPHAVTSNGALSPLALRGNMTRENNRFATIDPAASMGQLSLANLSDDLVASRLAARARSVEEDMEALVAPVESAPAPTVPELAAPSVMISQHELTDVGAELGESDYLHRWMVGSAVGLTTSLTVGYVLWTVRAGYLLTGLIAQVPAWRFVDPLPILNSLGSDRGPVDGESLASIVQANPNDAAISA